MKKILPILFLILLSLSYVQSHGQAPQGFRYQAVVRNPSGWEMSSQTVQMRFSFYQGSPAGTLVWEETHLLTSDLNGLIAAIIGTGASTGNGSQPSFSQVDWSAGVYYLKTGIDITGGTNFTDMGTAQLFSVPYALYSSSAASASSYSMGQITDVNLAGIAPGKVLKWSGFDWMPGMDNDSDTILFSLQSANAAYTDTVLFSFNSIPADSLLFAYYSDTADYAATAASSSSSASSMYSPTATYALSSPPQAWLVTGNSTGSSSAFMGTSDASDMVFGTNTSEVLRVLANGNLAAGAVPAIAGLSISGDNGFLHTGVFGTGAQTVAGPGARMLWNTAKAAFRAGAVTGTQWDNTNTGNYSFAVGYDVIAGPYAFASGNASVASGHYAVAMGYKSQATATGIYPSGTSVALGDSSIASMPRSVAIGRANVSGTSNASISIGSNNLSTGSTAMALGYSNIASGSTSTAIGNYASTNLRLGSIVIADASAATLVTSTVNHQFVARAAGGAIFYSDSAMTMGVSLPAGGGSWLSVSDRNKKENLQPVNSEEMLVKISQLKITSWNYRSQSSGIRHIGPMAQDFYRLFQVGESDSTITAVDIDGVIMSGIKGINGRILHLESLYQLDQLKEKLIKLDDFDVANKRLDAIEFQLKNNSQ